MFSVNGYVWKPLMHDLKKNLIKKKYAFYVAHGQYIA